MLDGQGFPFLAEYCYHYLTSNETLGITNITSEDVRLKVKHILEEVCKQIHDLHPHITILFFVDNDDDGLLNYENRMELYIMMEKCGSLTVSTFALRYESRIFILFIRRLVTRKLSQSALFCMMLCTSVECILIL